MSDALVNNLYKWNNALDRLKLRQMPQISQEIYIYIYQQKLVKDQKSTQIDKKDWIENFVYKFICWMKVSNKNKALARLQLCQMP